MKNICFFARVPDQNLFNLVGFYKDDIDSLRENGYNVTTVNRLRDLFRSRYDGYYVWWFGYGFFPAIFALLFQRPIIVTGAIHTEECGSINDWPIIKRILMKLTMRLSTLSIFISKTDFSKLDGFVPKSSEVVYCAVNLDIYKPNTRVPRFPAVISISHLTTDNVRRKKIFDCIRSFALAQKIRPDLQYWIIGKHGDAHDSVVKLINELNLSENITLFGSVSEKDKIDLLQKASVYLQPSFCEGFGLAILEAKACGTPVITSTEPCVKEINCDSVIYCDDNHSITLNIIRLIEDDNFYNKYHRYGLDSLGPFTLTKRKSELKYLSCKVFGV